MSTPSSENQGYNAHQIPPRQSRVENDDAKPPPTQNNEEKETAATNETVDNATPNARFEALVSRNQTESPNPPDAALRNVSPANPADSSLPASAPAPNRQSDAPISAAAPFVVSGLRVPSASSTPSRSSANVPPKPKLTVKLHLDAPPISIEKISKFCTETLPAQRLNYPKIKEPYYFRLDLGALFRQTVDEKSLFQFSYVEIAPQFEERYGLRCRSTPTRSSSQGRLKKRSTATSLWNSNSNVVKPTSITLRPTRLPPALPSSLSPSLRLNE